MTEDDLKITATLKEGATLTEEELFRWAIDQLPYFALPRYIEFRAELPRSPVGRVLKRELRDEGRHGRHLGRRDLRGDLRQAMTAAHHHDDELGLVTWVVTAARSAASAVLRHDGQVQRGDPVLGHRDAVGHDGEEAAGDDGRASTGAPPAAWSTRRCGRATQGTRWCRVPSPPRRWLARHRRHGTRGPRGRLVSCARWPAWRRRRGSDRRARTGRRWLVRRVGRRRPRGGSRRAASPLVRAR